MLIDNSKIRTIYKTKTSRNTSDIYKYFTLNNIAFSVGEVILKFIKHRWKSDIFVLLIVTWSLADITTH